MPPVWSVALPAGSTMSQWHMLSQLDTAYQDQVSNLYSQDLLPMEVRQYLAAWIESQDWNRAKWDTSVARVQFQNLLENLDNQYSRFSQEHEIVQRHNIRKFKQLIRDRCQERPQELAQIIVCVLDEERKILSTAQEAEQGLTEQMPQAAVESQRQQEIETRVKEVKQKVQSIDQDVKFLEEQQEMFDFRFKTYQTQVSSNQSGQQQMKTMLQVQLNKLDQTRKEILARLKELLGRCETLLHFLEEELVEWARRQQEACIGSSADVSLSLLESWLTRTAEAFFQLRRLLKGLAELPEKMSYDNDPLKSDPVILQRRVNELLTCLLKRAFVVEDQPIMCFPWKRSLVLRTSVRFSVSARLLVKLQELNHSLTVTAAIDNNAVNVKGYRKFNVLGTLKKNLSMDDVQKKGLIADFKYLTLKEQKTGTGGKGSKGINDGLVTEELHVMRFTMKFEYQGLELDLEAVTLPLVIISNVSQLSSAWASIIWFNLLSADTQNLAFFNNPPAAPWARLADALSWQFSFTTKLGLNLDQLSMLAEKLCGPHPKADSPVKWVKFFKENMPDVNFSFWTWFDGVLDLVKTHLENIWNDGHVMGFVSRSKEKSLLKRKVSGTFLLRFSESCRDGAVTFSWVDHPENGKPTVRSVQPYTRRDLQSIPLAEILHNYQILVEENVPENTLLYLYPDIPKDKAFGKYYDQNSEVNMEEYRRYMARRLIVVSERQPEIEPAPEADFCPVPMDIALPDISSLDLSMLMGTNDPMMPMMPISQEDFQ